MSEKRKLTDAECAILIAEVQSRSCLWNDKHNDFKNSVVTRELWGEVGQAINMSVDECKKKWKNLKDTFRKKVQISSAQSNSSSPPHKKWKFETLMEFTREVVLPSPMVEYIEFPSMEEEDDESTIDVEISEEAEPQEPPSPQQDPMSSSPEVDDRLSKLQRSLRSSRNKGNVEKQLLELEELKLNAILNMVKENDNMGDDHHFFLSLLPYVTRLGDVEKLQLRTTILHCVIEAIREHDSRKPKKQK